MRERIEYKAAGISTLTAGLLAHGYMLTNKLSYHDDSYSMFHLGGTFGAGRWTLGLVQKIEDIMGLGNYSVPLLNGIGFILCMAVVAILLVDMFEIHSVMSAVLIGAALVTFPVVTSTFAYMFTALYYGIGILFAVLSAYICVNTSWKARYGIGAVILACGMGIYQAYFGITAVLFVCYLIWQEDDFSVRIKRGISYLGVLIAGMICYFGVNRFCLFIFQEALYDYQGMNQMGQVTVSGLVSAIKAAYVQFFRPLYGDLSGLSSTRWSRLLYLCNAVICLMIFGIEFIRKKGFWNKVLQIILYIMLPLSVNIVYVMAMSDTTIVHTLMLMPYVFVILYGVLFLEKQNWIVWKRINYVVLTLFILYHMNLANIAYLKVNHQQEAAIAYYTEMISNIKSCEGYSDTYPVIFFGRIIDGWDLSISDYSEFDMVTLTGYNASDIAFIAYFCDDNFLKYHCGYTYQAPTNRSEIIATEQFIQMPCYPEDGSIAVIDNVVVVKLAEYE